MTPLGVLTAVGAVQQLRATVSGWSRRISVAAAFGVFAFLFVLVAVAFLATALFFALADTMSEVAAAAVVAAVLLVLAAIAALLARHAIRRGRGGTGTKLPVALPGTSHDDAFGGIDSRALYALAAGLIGGLIATQLRGRAHAETRKPD